MGNGNIFPVNLSLRGVSILHVPLGTINIGCIFKVKSEKTLNLAFEVSKYYFEGQRRACILADCGLDNSQSSDEVFNE